MRIVCVIPARGGSKGIPGKNLKVLAGRSLVGWSIHAAQRSSYQLRTIVSTDCDLIAGEARRCGAEVCMRPVEIAGDLASSESALLHVLESLAAKGEPQPDLLVFLQCTSPLTQAEDIDATIAELLSQDADTALAVAPFHYFLWKPGENGWNGVNHEKSVRLLRQEREPEFIETGAVYVMRVAGFLKVKHRFFGKTVAAEIPAERRWEIDDPEDLEIAEHLLKKQATPQLPFVPEAIVFDFDGVMTDNKVYVAQDGTESVRCDRGDGMGIERLRKLGIPMMILSKEENPVVLARATKLKMEIRHGIDHKLPVLQEWVASRGVSLNRCAYVGNDLNDLECLEAVGLSVAVADAVESVKAIAGIVLASKGGEGAVRELSDTVLVAAAAGADETGISK